MNMDVPKFCGVTRASCAAAVAAPPLGKPVYSATAGRHPDNFKKGCEPCGYVLYYHGHDIDGKARVRLELFGGELPVLSDRTSECHHVYAGIMNTVAWMIPGLHRRRWRQLALPHDRSQAGNAQAARSGWCGARSGTAPPHC